jgi:hypothetical protein
METRYQSHLDFPSIASWNFKPSSEARSLVRIIVGQQTSTSVAFATAFPAAISTFGV